MNQVPQLTALASAKDLAETVTVVSTQVDSQDATRRVENLIEHVIEPFTYRKLFKVLAYVNSVFAAIGDYQLPSNMDDPLELAKLVMHALAHAGDDVQAIVALALDRPVEYFDTLMPDDGLKLTIAVIRVNKDFFVQKILPMMAAVKAEVTELTNPGATS